MSQDALRGNSCRWLEQCRTSRRTTAVANATMIAKRLVAVGLRDNGNVLIREVALRQARLVLTWVTTCGYIII